MIPVTITREAALADTVKVKATNIEVKCSACGRKLGLMFDSDKFESKFKTRKHIFICPCSGESFSVFTHKYPSFLSESNCVLHDIITNGDNNIYILKDKDE